MTKFVIRSMSTTDYVCAGHGRPEQKPEPYHIYLVKPENRAGAWWRNWIGDAMKFDTMEAAQAEIDRCFAGKAWYELPQPVAMDGKLSYRLEELPMTPTQRAVYDRLTNVPQSAYRLRASLATLRALVKLGYARDVTKPGAGGMFSPRTHFEFVRGTRQP